MALSVERYLDKGRHYDVLDLGSQNVTGSPSHRDVLTGYRTTYVGVDTEPGTNVDRVMRKPYRIPARAKSFDLVMSGQAFEHIPFFWASFLEIVRVLRPGGLVFLTAPSRGHIHWQFDCWRFYPDSMRALAAWARIDLLEAHTDMPPRLEGAPGNAVDYTKITSYWGDTIGVFQKPTDYRAPQVALIREATVWWANRLGGIQGTPRKYGAKGRFAVTLQSPSIYDPVQE